MPFLIKKKLFRKLISLGLSVILIYNTTIPAIAQEFNFNGDLKLPEIVQDNSAFRNQISKQLYLESEAYQDYHGLTNVREKKLAAENQTYARALQIKYAILGDPNEIMTTNTKSFFRDKEMGPEYQQLNDRQKIYVQTLYQEAEKVQTEIDDQYQYALKLIDQNVEEAVTENVLSLKEINTWKEENLAQLNSMHQKALKDLNDYLQQEIKNTQNIEEEYEREIEKNPDAFFDYVKPLVSELLDLYKKEPQQAKEHILQLTSVIVGLVNTKGEHLYNDEQAELLMKLYQNVIEEEKANAEEKVSGIVSFLNENVLDYNIDTEPGKYRCKTSGDCRELTSAFLGLAVLDSLQREKSTSSFREASNDTLIYNTMNAYHDTAGNIPVISSGFSALLLMKSYNLAEDFLKYRNSIERDINGWDYVINFTKIVTDIAKTNGEYMGNASQYGRYDDEEGHFQNVYFDLAQMLAEDGSKEALNILRRQGVERCIVQGSSSVQKDTLSRYSVNCYGILPFLVGALVSGKSGAKDYAIVPSIDPSKNKGVDTVKENIKDINHNFHYVAKTKFNNDPDAMLALHIMGQAMGDLNHREEYQLDSFLDKFFTNRIPEDFLGAKRIIIDEKRKAKKYYRTIIKAGFISLGIIADAFFTIYCFYDLPEFGGKILSFGRNMVKAFKAAKAGVKVTNLASLGKFIKTFNKNLFVKNTTSKRIIKMKRYAQAFREEIFSQGTKYTSLVDKHAAVVTGFARRNHRFTMHLRDMLKAIIYDTKKDVFKFGHIGKFFQPAAVKEIKNIFDIALLETKNRMRLSRFLRREADFGKIFLQEAEKAVASSHLSLADKKTMIAFFKSADFKPVLDVATENVNLIKKSTLRNFADAPLVLKTFVGEGNMTKPSETEFVIAENIPAFEEKVPEFVSVVKHGVDYLLKFPVGTGEVIDFSAFKLAFADTDGFINFVRQAITKGKEATIELKFMPKEGNTFWHRNVRSAFINKKEKLLSGRGSVSLISNGKMYETGITLRTYKKYDGVQLIVHDDLGLGGVVTALKNNKQLPVTLEGSLFLPKYQLKNYLKFTKGADLVNPIKISLLNGRNKMRALYVQALVSLGVAYSGLIGPLSANYPDIDARSLNLIAIVLPYVFSIGAPFVAPLIKKFGAVNMLKTSMYLSLVSLALPMVVGFNGFGAIQADTPFSKPSPKLLYPSALLIGLASALTRGSSSVLVQAVGGGNGALKMKAYKSISSFIMVLPPLIGAGLDYMLPHYFKNSDGTLYLNEAGNPVRKHWFDFSISYPVVFTIAGLALYNLQKAHFNTNIGKDLTRSFNSIGAYMKDGMSSYGVLFKKEMLPLTMASLLLNGAEASLLYSFSNSLTNEYVGNRVRTEAFIPVLALLWLNSLPFISRMNAKPILKFFGGDNVLGYRNILTTSIALTGAGAYLLTNQNDSLSFALGLALTSLGFSQITASILRYGHIKLATELKMPSHIVTSWDVSYPIVYIGSSAVSYLYGYMSDQTVKGLKVEQKDKRSLKNTSLQEMIGIPVSALVLGSMQLYKGMAINGGKFNLLGNTSILAPLGIAGEIQAQSFVFPKPTHTPGLKTPFNIDGADNFKANIEMPEFKFTSMVQK